MMQLSELEELEQLLDEELESSQDFLHFVDLSQGMVFLENEKVFLFLLSVGETWLGKLIEKLTVYSR